MSVRWMRTTKIRNGKFMEAIAWAKETSAHVEKKHNVGKVSIWLDSLGEAGTIRWSIDFPDMAAFDKMMSAVMIDADYWKMVNKAVDLFHDGTTVDQLFKAV